VTSTNKFYISKAENFRLYERIIECVR